MGIRAGIVFGRPRFGVRFFRAGVDARFWLTGPYRRPTPFRSGTGRW